MHWVTGGRGRCYLLCKNWHKRKRQRQKDRDICVVRQSPSALDHREEMGEREGLARASWQTLRPGTGVHLRPGCLLGRRLCRGCAWM